MRVVCAVSGFTHVGSLLLLIVRRFAVWAYFAVVREEKEVYRWPT